MSANASFIARQKKLTALLEREGLDALAINPGPSLPYLTGLHFHLSERPVVALFTRDHAPVVVLPELEGMKVEGLPYTVTCFTYTESLPSWDQAFARAIETAGLRGKKIGVEPRCLRVLELRFLEHAAPNARFVSGESVVSTLRMQKDDVELNLMQKATVIAQDALLATLPLIREGITEREVAAELVLQLLRHGSQPELPFQPIVAFGENSANPHAVPSGRKLMRDELVLIDWGANVDGYLSDLTRTFAFGTVDPELNRIAEIVANANEAGRLATRPGVTAGSIDQAARDAITNNGYGDFFIHRTGHGLGLETHEEPYIRGDNTQVLKEGMTFTIEPGIYLPGVGGVRIEDDMVVTANGAESLSDLPRGLATIGD